MTSETKTYHSWTDPACRLYHPPVGPIGRFNAWLFRGRECAVCRGGFR